MSKRDRGVAPCHDTFVHCSYKILVLNRDKFKTSPFCVSCGMFFLHAVATCNNPFFLQQRAPGHGGNVSLWRLRVGGVPLIVILLKRKIKRRGKEKIQQLSRVRGTNQNIRFVNFYRLFGRVFHFFEKHEHEKTKFQ